METSKKIVIGAVVSLALVTGLLVRFGALASGEGGSGVSVSMPAAKVLQIFQNGSDVSLGADEEGSARLGSATDVTTVFTAVSTTEDVGVGRNLTVLGTSQFNGTTTFSGPISGNAMPASEVVSFTSVSSTGALCSILNDTGSDRVLDAADLVYTTTTQTALAYSYFTVSQSATAAATGTGSNLFFSNDRLAVPITGLRTVTPTSTLLGFGDGTSSIGPVRIIWRANSYINFLTGVPNSLFTGTCRVVSH